MIAATARETARNGAERSGGDEDGDEELTGAVWHPGSGKMTGDSASDHITLPAGIRPSDGRFGSGPSRVRPEAVAALAAAAGGYLGTSHRRAGVRQVVARLRDGFRDLFSLPPDWEVVLGNGGATGLWDCLGFGLIRRRSQHLAFGEFSAKFARAVQDVPHLEAPQIIEAPFGTPPRAGSPADVDVYALTHNETSTGVRMPLRRPPGVGAADGLGGRGRHLRRRGPALGSRRGGRVLPSRRRSASPPTAGCGWRAARRPPWSASPRSGTAGAGAPRRSASRSR